MLCFGHPFSQVQELSGLLAMAGAAHQQLKETLAPGSTWAKSVFGDQAEGGPMFWPLKCKRKGWKRRPKWLKPAVIG